MHRVIAGCNLWAVLFLGVALVMGASHARHHVAVGVFAVVFALFAQCANFALFMGASKLLKEHVLGHGVPSSYLERNSALLFQLLPWAFAGSLTLLAVGLVAGLGASGEVPVLVHVVLGSLAIGVVAVAIPKEVRVFRELHELLVAMEAELPEEPVATIRGVADGVDGVVAPQVDLRARALVYVGGTAVAMALGYKYISGLPLPGAALAVVIGLSLVCFGVAAWSARRTRQRRSMLSGSQPKRGDDVS